MKQLKGLLALVCAVALLAVFALPVLGAEEAQLDALLEQAERSPEEAGKGFWAAFAEAPEEFLAWLAEKENPQTKQVLSAMSMGLPEEKETMEGYLQTLYTLIHSVPEEQRNGVYRLMLVLEMHVESPLAYDDYDLLMEKAFRADGASTERCLAQLAQAFRAAPEKFLQNMARKTPEQQELLASLVKQGVLYYHTDYDLDAELDALEETLTDSGQLQCVQLLRGSEKPVETPTQPPASQPATDPTVQPVETAPSEPIPTTEPVTQPTDEDARKQTGEDPASGGLWWLAPIGLVIVAAGLWAVFKSKHPR